MSRVKKPARDDSFPMYWTVSPTAGEPINPPKTPNFFFIPMKSPIKTSVSASIASSKIQNLKWNIVDVVHYAKTIVPMNAQIHAINVSHPDATELVSEEEWSFEHVSYKLLPISKSYSSSSLNDFCSHIQTFSSDGSNHIFLVYSGKGLNRPALAIASYLIYSKQSQINDSISRIRKSNPNYLYSFKALDALAKFSNAPEQIPPKPPEFIVPPKNINLQAVKLIIERQSYRKATISTPLNAKDPLQTLKDCLKAIRYPFFTQYIWGSSTHSSNDVNTVSEGGYYATFNPVGIPGFIVIEKGNISFIDIYKNVKFLHKDILSNFKDDKNTPIIFSVVFTEEPTKQSHRQPKKGLMIAKELLQYGKDFRNSFTFDDCQYLLAKQIIPKLSPVFVQEFFLEFAVRPLASLGKAEQLYRELDSLFFVSNGISLINDVIGQEIVITPKASIVTYVRWNGGKFFVLFGNDENGYKKVVNIIEMEIDWAEGLHNKYVRFEFNGAEWVPKSIFRETTEKTLGLASTVNWINEAICCPFNGIIEEAFRNLNEMDK